MIDIQNVFGAFIHRIQLNYKRPSVSISITSGTGDCGDFKPRDPISGLYSVTSPYLRNYTLGASVPGATGLTPTSGNNPVAGAAWNMTIPAATPQCGYFMAINARDRTIINSSKNGWHAHGNAGFCVRKK